LTKDDQQRNTLLHVFTDLYKKINALNRNEGYKTGGEFAIAKLNYPLANESACGVIDLLN